MLIIGAIFLLNFLMGQQTSFTGAFLGAREATNLFGSFWLGIIFLILGLVLFSSSLTLEKIAVSTAIEKPLLKLAEKIKDESVRREMKHLYEELEKGNFQAGLGHPGHIEGTDIFYLRGRNGARLYYHKIGKDNYQIVGKSSKANQEQVINKLKNFY